MQFTRMPRGASSIAAHFVMPLMAHLLAPYAHVYGAGCTTQTDA